MKTFSTIVVAFFICTLAFGQTKKADRLFEKWEYAAAAEKYEAAVKKDPSPENYYRLGQCYQEMFLYREAINAYDKVNAAGAFGQADFYLNYGLMLKSNERYNEAREAFSKYSNLAPNDARGKMYMNSCDVVLDDLAKPVGVTVTNLSMNNADAAFSPVVYDGGIVYASNAPVSTGGKEFKWTGKSYLDLFYAKRGSSDTEFDKGGKIDSKVNTKYHDGPASFTKNGDTMYFNRVSKDLKGAEKRTLGIERSKIYSAVKKDGEWTEIESFKYNSNAYGMLTPFVTVDGSRLYFASDMPGGMGETDIYYCVREGNGWSAPINVGANVNTLGREQFPTVDADGNLYFSSTGYMGYGGLDICIAQLLNGSFQSARVLKAPLNSSGNDYGMAFLKSGKSGYLSSNRLTGMGDADIYYFNIDKDSLPCEVNTTIYVIGFECPKKEEVAEAEPIDSLTSVVVVDVNPSGMIINPIYFDFDKSDIRNDAVSSLDNVASIMKAHPEWYLQVSGNADARGSSEYNVALSQRRANAAVKYLASKGISTSRIKTQAYGESKLKNGCSDGVDCSEAEQQLNRRVEFTLSLQKKEVVKR